MKRILAGLSLVISLIAVNLSPLLAQAAGASISLTVNKHSVSAGSSLIVAVYMNGGGTPVNAVEADLTYPASKLQYVGLSYTGSAFSINTPGNGGSGGSVSIQNGTITPVSGGALIATVTFKALVSSGSASVAVAGSSHLINANDNSSVPYVSSGTSVSFGGGTSASTNSSSSTPSKTATATPAPSKDTTPPTISAIAVTRLTPFSATITWTTNKAADSAVDYGLDANYGLSDSSSALATSHSVSLDSSFLVPETTFHFRVRSTDSAGNVGISSDQTFSLPGVPVTVVVLGPNGKPQAGAQVTIDGSTATTNSNGSATLSSGLGNKKITTTYQGVTVQKPITVSKSAKPLPPYQLDLTKQPLNRWMLTSMGLIVVVLTLLGIDAVLFGSRLLARLVGVHLMSPRWHEAHQAVAAASTPAPTAPAQMSTPHSEPTLDEPSPAPVNASEAVSSITPVAAELPLREPESPTLSRFGATIPTAPATPPSPAPTTTKINVLDDNQAPPTVVKHHKKSSAKSTASTSKRK